MEFLLLGPVLARVGSRAVNLGVRKQRFVLAVLAMEVNRLVTAERLVDLCWPDDPPRSARRIIHTQISRLRTTLANIGGSDDGLIRSAGSGYLLECAPERIDAYRFSTLMAQAREAGDDSLRRLDLLDRALALWRGPALAGAVPETVRADLCGPLDQARVDALEDRLEALLRLGRLPEVIGEGARLAHEHPHRYRITGARIRALHRAGRTPEALDAYRDTKQRLATDLGLDPPAELADLEVAILRGDPAETAPSPPTPADRAVPRQLPTDASAFTGRRHELDRLCAPPPAGRDRSPGRVPVFVIDGMAGVGKTALAVHAAHLLADRFPDGQVFIDLHGHTPGIDPVEPAAGLAMILLALGVPAAQLPAGLDARTALYRTRLADSATLILLDNAGSEGQVEPLRPASPDCLVLVTSRRRLVGLDGAEPLSLDVLPVPDAVRLFHGTAAVEIPASAEASVERVVELCGRLPLAIRVAAARLRHRPGMTPADLAELLADQRHRLGELHAGNRSLSTAFDLSYQGLSADQQRLFRLLAVHPGADVEPYAAAALAGSPVRAARTALDELLDAHLLGQHTAGRYRFHDLLRVYAAARCDREVPPADRRAALDRLLDHYAAATSAAMEAGYPPAAARPPAGRRPGIRQRGGTMPAFDDAAAAERWLDAELVNLLACAAHAGTHGRPDHTVHASATLHRHLRTRGHYPDAATLHRQACAAAQTTGDPGDLLVALDGLGDSHYLQGRYDEAVDCHQRALNIARDTGDRAGERDAEYGLGHAWHAQGKHDQAADHLGRALRIAREAGNRTGELDALGGLGYIHYAQGRHDQALDSFDRALHIARDTANQTGELNALRGLGHVWHARGAYGRAIEHHERALCIARDTANRTGELDALGGLGYAHYALGQHDRAVECLTDALRIARSTGRANGELSALLALGHARYAQGRYRQAADEHEQALQIARGTGNRNGQFEAQHGLGRCQHALGRPDHALANHHCALALAAELGQPADQARAHDGLAHTYAALGRPAAAHQHWHAALHILLAHDLEHTDDPQVTAATIRGWLGPAAGDGQLTS